MYYPIDPRKCEQCKKNPDRPHICAEAQQLGEDARCCGPDAKGCFSFREVSRRARLQWGNSSDELYLQAIFNSQEMNLE